MTSRFFIALQSLLALLHMISNTATAQHEQVVHFLRTDYRKSIGCNRPSGGCFVYAVMDLSGHEMAWNFSALG